MKICIYPLCNNELKSRDRNAKFCSNKCSGAHQSHSRIEAWLSGKWDGSKKHGLSSVIRNFLLKEANYQCIKCGWAEVNEFTGKVPLEVNHIDGDYLNNRRENLEVLCPNCHSLTGNYKALNKNSGRAWRKRYPQYELKGKRMADATRTTCSCGAKKTSSSKMCLQCSKFKKREVAESKYPPLETLITMVEKNGYEAVGRELGVSGNSVKKHLKVRGIILFRKRTPTKG